MKLAVIALRVLIVPVLQREPASVWRNNCSGVPAMYSGQFGFELRPNHKDSHLNRLSFGLCSFLASLIDASQLQGSGDSG